MKTGWLVALWVALFATGLWPFAVAYLVVKSVFGTGNLNRPASSEATEDDVLVAGMIGYELGRHSR